MGVIWMFSDGGYRWRSGMMESSGVGRYNVINMFKVKHIVTCHVGI